MTWVAKLTVARVTLVEMLQAISLRLLHQPYQVHIPHACTDAHHESIKAASPAMCTVIRVLSRCCKLPLSMLVCIAVAWLASADHNLVPHWRVLRCTLHQPGTMIHR